MSCPDCHKETRQQWHGGYPATQDTPGEPAGYECGWCGCEYPEDFRSGDDAAYDQRVAEQLDAA